jgi:hypothetical protein
MTFDPTADPDRATGDGCLAEVEGRSSGTHAPAQHDKAGLGSSQDVMLYIRDALRS